MAGGVSEVIRYTRGGHFPISAIPKWMIMPLWTRDTKLVEGLHT